MDLDRRERAERQRRQVDRRPVRPVERHAVEDDRGLLGGRAADREAREGPEPAEAHDAQPGLGREHLPEVSHRVTPQGLPPEHLIGLEARRPDPREVP